MNSVNAINDFKRAHRKAAFQEIFAKLTGQSANLLSYEEVFQKIRIQGQAEKGLRDIPLDAIIGSVGRYRDFTRSFFPRNESDQERWARVKTAVESMEGVPPIDVYKVGEAYFVKDGNHRVSIARQIGAEYIQAYVTEVKTRVSIDKDTDMDDLIIKAEYDEFLERTQLNKLRPEANFSVTAPGSYEQLLDHISVHRYFMGIDENREVSYREAVIHWYDEVFLPIVKLIRRLGVLRDFPQRTETDLYLWFLQYRYEIQTELGWRVSDKKVAESFVSRFGTSFRQVFKRLNKWLLDMITPDSLDSGPASGSWRKEHEIKSRSGDTLFENILVPLHENEANWTALEQACQIAHREKGAIFGLHVIPKKPGLKEKQEKKNKKIKSRFEKYCQNNQIEGGLAVLKGKITTNIVYYSRWTDLVVINLCFPPSLKPLAKLRSGFRILVHRSGVPVLALRGEPSPMTHALLAFDGSQKAQEALFVAAYLAQAWGTRLSIISVEDGDILAATAQEQAREYLESNQVEAEYLVKKGNVSEAILKTSLEIGSDLIIMGSYGYTPIIEVFLGSAVDKVLLDSKVPILICR